MTTQAEWQSFRFRLKTLEKEVAKEIQNYPSPIPGCDAQFNYLLEMRRLLPREAVRLERTMGDQSLTMNEFVDSSPCRDTLSPLMLKD